MDDPSGGRSTEGARFEEHDVVIVGAGQAGLSLSP
jgi:ribulose 1,5-bisphosphate synthetase/thiazole synthase